MIHMKNILTHRCIENPLRNMTKNPPFLLKANGVIHLFIDFMNSKGFQFI